MGKIVDELNINLYILCCSNDDTIADGILNLLFQADSESSQRKRGLNSRWSLPQLAGPYYVLVKSKLKPNHRVYVNTTNKRFNNIIENDDGKWLS